MLRDPVMVRLVIHGAVGWAACAAIMGALLATTSLDVAVGVHAVAAPVVFALVARHYFRKPGARGPFATAIAFTSIVGLLDLVIVATLIERSYAMFASIAGTWLPFVSIFAVTWVVGAARRK